MFAIDFQEDASVSFEAAIPKAVGPPRNGTIVGQDVETSGGGPVRRVSGDAIIQASERLRAMRIEEGRIPRMNGSGHNGSPSAKASPMRIASPSPARLSRAMSREQADKQQQEAPAKLDFDQVRKVSGRNRRRKKGIQPGAPATVTVRGFDTPKGSGGEESDYSQMSTPKVGPRVNGLESITSSPALRPVSGHGGISMLRQLSNGANLDGAPARSSPVRASSGLKSDMSSSETASDGERMEVIQSQSVDIKLDEDFVSESLTSSATLYTSDSGYDTTTRNTMVRKMCADDFEPIKCLGKGSFGTVLLVRHRESGRLFAQKQLRKKSLQVQVAQQQARTERQILESVNRHPFVVKLFYAFQDQQKLYLILEYAEGGELFYHLNMTNIFTEEHASFYMAEIVLALEHLHRNVGVVYRDLKPENLLLDADGHILLTDFGLSKAFDEDSDDVCKSFVGTFEYMAPEVIKGEEYGFAVDWWSLGALGVELMTGNSPFTANNRAKIEENILRKKFVPPYYLSPDAKDLLIRLLRKKPKERLGANMPRDLQTIKRHRFFRKIDWRRLQRREAEPPFRPMITDPALAENFSKTFTDQLLSPTGQFLDRRFSADGVVDGAAALTPASVGNPFGGFSFTASSSLLEGGVWA